MATETKKLTWQRLTQAEPRLKMVQRYVKLIVARTASDERFCANAAWYGYDGYPSIKEMVSGLVGWEARGEDPILHTPEAYDLVYDRLYALLPDCRNCGCL